MKASMADFRLEKWYFDCVTSDGAVLIGYAARLKWGPIGLSYGARMAKMKGGPLVQRQCLAFGTVNEGRGTISWANDLLKVHGVWTGGEPIPRIVVVDEPSGRIEWQCLGANCAVAVCLDGQRVMGTGYVEKLTMSIPPWKLPFTGLRWGRFISDDRSSYMVWTDMRGRTPRTWVWVNSGQPVAGIVDSLGVRTDVAELAFLSSEPLRSGNVATTLLGRLQFLKRLLPEGLRAIQEDKQVSACVVRTKGSELTGSSINEVVTWGRA
jgi:hypothetical protein